MTVARRWGTLTTAALVVALAGCAGASTPFVSTPVVEPQSWTQLALPDGFTASTLLLLNGQLVVGGSEAGGPDGDGQPAFFATGGSGSTAFTPVPVAPESFYGARTLWFSVISDGSQIFALGGKTGGGHGNPRWTTWAGDLAGVVEDPAPGIEVFGGWGAGGLAGMAVVNGQPVIVGGHASSQPGLDIAVWLHQGDDWVRQSSDATALAATGDVLPFPTAVAVEESELVIAGFAQHLGGGKVWDAAAIWVGGQAGPWSRIDLPGDAAASSAQAVSCDGERCIVTGEADGALVAWTFANGTVASIPIPVLETTDRDVLASVTWGGRTTLVAPGGVATSTDLNTWSLHAGPSGTPIAATSSGSILYVLTSDADGSVRLWSAAG
ncbi:MAG: hypothetical protein ABIR17_12695 [Pseudolysinimonas sp.]|uniref:hypothetical protein n=1 Tax=Pseudolysinimonas sp. TaxID=2680009 RepID=UPI003265860F